MPTTITIRPNVFFSKIMEVFQPIVPERSIERIEEKTAVSELHTNEVIPIEKPKLQISMDDLKVISTALLHFQKQLKRKGEEEKAEEVKAIDSRFYELITFMEEKKKKRQTNNQNTTNNFENQQVVAA